MVRKIILNSDWKILDFYLNLFGLVENFKLLRMFGPNRLVFFEYIL